MWQSQSSPLDRQQPPRVEPQRLPPIVDHPSRLPPVINGPQANPVPAPPVRVAEAPRSSTIPQPVPGMEPRFPSQSPETQQPESRLAVRPRDLPAAPSGPPALTSPLACGPDGCPPGGFGAEAFPPQGKVADCPPFAFSTPAPYVDDCKFVPPGIGQPWPYDEYIWNGCDINDDVRVKQDWSVTGLDLQDTIAHYDTVDGETKVTRANCVPIYAPRFAAARKVVDLVNFDAAERLNEQMQPLVPHFNQEDTIVTTAVQPVQALDGTKIAQPLAFRDRNQGIIVQGDRLPFLAQKDFLPHEDLLIIRRGEFQADEKARLAAATDAAIVWTKDVGAQVVLDGDIPAEAKNPLSPQGITVYDRLGKPCLRIIKVASKSEALPGEIIDFTLRFDNLGTETVGNVTIIDNLVSRLEYVVDSQECSLPADFIATRNEGESLTLRWEIKDPLPKMQGGIIRFQCRVR